MKLSSLLWIALKGCASCIGHLVLWTIWLFLAVLLVIQIVVASSHELRVPSQLVKVFEHRLALAGLHASFETASFDPSGHVLIENLQLFSDSFEEPLVSCKSLFLKLDPLSLAVGSLEAKSIGGRGLTFYVPPMFSPSGRSEPVLSDLDLAVRLADQQVYLEKMVGHAGSLTVTCSGGMWLPSFARRGNKPQRDPRELVTNAINQYVHSARQLALWQAKLAAFEKPAITLVLTPDEFRLARAAVRFSAISADFTEETLGLPSFKSAIRVTNLWLQTSLPLLLGKQVNLQALITADRVEAADGSRADELKTRLTGLLQTEPWRVQIEDVTSSIARVSSHNVDLLDLSLAVEPRAWPRVNAEVSAVVADEPWTVRASGDFLLGAGEIAAQGRVSPALLSLVGKKIGRNLNELVVPNAPANLVAAVQINPGWKPAKVQGHLEVGKVLARGVSIDHASADLSYAGTALEVTDVLLAQGENRAAGTYSMDTKSLDYRFLLTGHLRPVGISGWFHDWWTHFWSSFDFSVAAPDADVDVRGRWREPELTTVFVFADCVSPTVRSVAFDRVRTTLFIRPDFYEGTEFFATRGRGQARGHFTRAVDLEKRGFRWMEFKVNSTLDVQETAPLFGQVGIDLVDPFRFEKPPTLTLTGRLEGEASDKGEHEQVEIDVASDGGFNFFGFPVSDLNCRAAVKDHEITVTGLHVHFADGEVQGTAHLTGRGDERQLSFDASLKDASLGKAIQTLEEFGAKRRGEKPPEVSRFQQRVASGKLDLSAAAAGLYKNPYSFVGTGKAELKGAEFAEINLLGSLSEALRGSSLLGFTSWRLDNAQSSFTIERSKLLLPDLHITGPTARLEAHGSYALDSKLINFNAKFYPFEQGKTLLASAVGFVLTPFSAVLELRLAGNLEQPKWFFAYGPTSLFRKLAGTEEKKEAAQPETPSSPPPLLLRR